LGTLVRCELIRLLRRRQTFRGLVLALYSLFLTAALLTVWHFSPTQPFQFFREFSPARVSGPQVLAQVESFITSGKLLLSFLEAQLAFVAALAPAFGAVSLSEEKDRQTLQLLFITELENGDIVCGKAFARMLFVLGVLLAVSPLQIVLVFWGGCHLEVLLAGMFLTLGTVFLATAIGIVSACVSNDTRTTFIRAYALTALLIGGCLIFPQWTPFGALFNQAAPETAGPDSGVNVHARFGPVLAYTAAQGGLGGLLLLVACRTLRKRDAVAGTYELTAFPEPPKGRAVPIPLSDPGPPPHRLPPINERNPLLWKERNEARSKTFPILDRPGRLIVALLACVAMALFLQGAWRLLDMVIGGLDPDRPFHLADVSPRRPDAGGLLLAAGVLSGGLYLLPVVVGVTGCVSRERRYRTLDCLLTTPLARGQILWAKVHSQLERGLIFGIGSLAAVAAGFAAGGGLELGLAAMGLVGSGFWFATAVAAWLSVRCPTHLRAFWLSLPVMLGVIELPAFAWKLTDWNATAPVMAGMLGLTAVLGLAGVLLGWRAVVRLSYE
jgi:ABC-type transport system involved in multi-copper enzyme maturation permease subunit